MNHLGKPSGERASRPDRLAGGEIPGQFWWIIPAGIGIVAALLWPVLRHKPTAGRAQVIAYCAQDQVYAEPIFKEFERETGIAVRAVYDNEAVKTVGLANRLLAERFHPRCDVFWGNEELRTRQLVAQNVFRQTNGWAAFGHRSRRIVINTNLVSAAAAPHSLLELTNPVWSGRVALAYPQFGTTATHLHALRQFWGDALWQTWCRDLAANHPFLVDGNSMVVKLVGKGEAGIGLTDSDDAADAQREGLPIAALPVTAETLLIPNTVGVIRGGPHPREAEALFAYLQRPAVVDTLLRAQALEGSVAGDPLTPTLKPDWAALLADLERTTEELNRFFLR